MIKVRGAVLVETALFVSAALIFMLGTMQIGGLGFLQLTADSAAYFDARANVLTVYSGTPESQTNLAFNQIPVPDIAPTVLPAPTPTVPVDYGYNSSNQQEQQNSPFQRHGGASMLQPAQLLSTVSVPNLANILGNSLGVTGTDIEAMWVECGPHFNVSNVAGCSEPGATATQQTNYFANGEYTPPYFVGFNFMQECYLMGAGPFGQYTGGNANKYKGVTAFNGPGSPPSGLPGGSPGTWGGPCSNGSNSGNSEIGFLALGTAEYLDTTNWQDTSSGVSGPCDQSQLPNAGTNQSAFEAAAFHQREYALIGEYLEWSLLNQGLYDVERYSYRADPTYNPNNYFGAYCGPSCGAGKISAGDLAGSPGSATAGTIATPETITGFTQWEGFDNPNYYPGDGQSPSDIYNQAVQTVYGWDRTVGSGSGPSDPSYNNPTYPENGCT